MTVLFISRKYPPSIGGMQLFAYDLHTAIAKQVTTRLIKWGGSNKALPAVLPMFFFKACHQLAKGGVNVIHMQDAMLAPLGWFLSKISRKPYTVVVHGLDITFGNPLYQAVIPRFVRKASKVFCISQAAADEAAKRGVPREKLIVIPLAVDDKLYGKSNRADLLKRVNLPEDSQLLLTVGRLVKRKGVAWFVSDVMPDLVKEYPKLVYLVVGEGGSREEIEAAITKTKLQDHVKLLGRVEDDLYEAAYNGSDVFVMPNIPVPNNIEGFGLVVLEAALCELPVVAAETEGIQDAVANGHNGILVPVKDVVAFKHYISHFLDNPADAEAFGKHSRAFTLENYQWDGLAERYVEVYKDLQKKR